MDKNNNNNKNKQQLFKGLHHLCNAWKTTYQRNKSKCNKCPLCLVHIKSWQHVLQCNNEHIVHSCIQFLTMFDQGLTAMHTAPNLTEMDDDVRFEILISKKRNTWTSKIRYHWHKSTRLMFCTKTDRLWFIHSLIHSLIHSFIDSFIQGLIVTDFRLLQQKQYKEAHHPVKHGIFTWLVNVTLRNSFSGTNELGTTLIYQTRYLEDPVCL